MTLKIEYFNALYLESPIRFITGLWLRLTYKESCVNAEV